MVNAEKNLLIKNAHIIDCSQNSYADVYIENGLICEINKTLSKNCKTIDGSGLVLMPSFVDMHAHFREPGFTYKEDILSGSMAAVRGGYTAVNLMPNTSPVISSSKAVFYVTNKAEQIGLVDVHQSVSITKDFNGKDITHLDNLDGSVKVITEDGSDVMDSVVMLEAMIKASKLKIIVMAHCEDKELAKIDSRLSENIMSFRNIELAKYAGCHFHLAHISTKEAMGYVIDAKKLGYFITCEVMPHHIALTNAINYSVNPPLRTAGDIEFLISAIKEGWVDVIATDHAPHSKEDKAKGSPGISGIETAFPVCYTKLVRENNITLNKLSQLMSKKPAEMLGLNKGEIRIGFDGDVVLINLNKEFNINSDDFASKGKNTPFEHSSVYGKVITTIKLGKIVYDKGNFYCNTLVL